MTDDRPLLPQYRLYTVDDYDRLPDDDRRFELIGGELIEKDAEGLGQDRSMTVADLDYLPPDGPRYEILDGVLFPLPAPDAQHQRVVLAFLRLLNGFIAAHASGEAMVSPPWVVLGEHDVSLPDLIFLANGRRDAVRPDRILEAPDIVVEVSMLPTIGRDLGRKDWIYIRAGVREYWTVNLVEDVAVRVHDETTYVRRAEFVRDVVVSSTILPGLTVDVRQLFAGDSEHSLHW